MAKLLFRSLVLTAGFAVGFWLARDGHARELALCRLQAVATRLSAALRASSSQPPQALQLALAAPESAPQASQAPAPREAEVSPPLNLESSTPRDVQSSTSTLALGAEAPAPPAPEERYLEAVRIIEAGPADHGVK